MAGGAIDPYNASVQLLACLTVAVQAAANPPQKIQFLPGNQAGEDISEFEDLCRCGTAYVRVSTVYPSFQDFPAPDTLAIPCQQQALGVVYEVGIMRCAPVGSVQHVPTAAEWLAAFQQQMVDMTSLMKAACCFRNFYPLDAMLIGAWTPTGPQGACLLGTINITHQITGCGDCS